MAITNKVLAGYKYVANFLDAPVRIGMIYRLDDKQFIPAISFNDVFPEIDLGRWTDTGTPGNIQFTQSKDVSIKFSADVPSQIGKSEVKMNFSKSNTVAGALKDAIVESVRYENILPQLKSIWTDRGFMKYRREYVFVYQIVTAASGTVIYSEESKNEVVLKHKLGEPLGGMAELASGNVEFVKNTKRTIEIIRQVAHKPLFGAFRFLKTWEPEILG